MHTKKSDLEIMLKTFSDNYNDFFKIKQEKFEGYLKYLRQLESDKRELVETLEFYADIDRPDNEACVWCDHGKKARDILERVKK